ncbi:MAG: 5-formyltetrahydrofolate cyclo-ligase, partial [Pseudomonadota bacterium]
MITSSPTTKSALRKQAKALRDTVHASHGATARTKIAAHKLSFCNPKPGAQIAGYVAMRSELDPDPLLQDLANDGFQLCLPQIIGTAKPLVMRAWSNGISLEAGPFGTKQPTNTPIVNPEILLVPLLAFDRQGYRLGYGGGFYDRTIEQLKQLKPVCTIGIAYDEQEVDSVPVEATDQRLDWVLTPAGPKKC